MANHLQDVGPVPISCRSRGMEAQLLQEAWSDAELCSRAGPDKMTERTWTCALSVSSFKFIKQASFILHPLTYNSTKDLTGESYQLSVHLAARQKAHLSSQRVLQH